MPRIVKCAKLSRELPGIEYKPFDSDLGQRIYDEISQDAWKLWLEHSKMLINEFHLDLLTTEAQQLLLERCEQFFFGEGSALPPDFVPQQTPTK